MAAAQAKGDITFTGAVDLSGATVTNPDALDVSANHTWTGDNTYEGAVDLSSATVTLAAGEIDSADITTGAVDPAHLSATAVSPAAHAACAILNTTTEINVTVDDASNVAISTTSSVAGQRIRIRCLAASGGGSYTLAVTGGTLTLNSVGETALVARNAANDAWLPEALTAGSAGGSAATIV